MKEVDELKSRIIMAGKRAVEQLIKVANEEIITGGDDDVSADRLKNAAASKRLAISPRLNSRPFHWHCPKNPLSWRQIGTR